MILKTAHIKNYKSINDSTDDLERDDLREIQGIQSLAELHQHLS